MGRSATETGRVVRQRRKVGGMVHGETAPAKTISIGEAPFGGSRKGGKRTNERERGRRRTREKNGAGKGDGRRNKMTSDRKAEGGTTAPLPEKAWRDS